MIEAPKPETETADKLASLCLQTSLTALETAVALCHAPAGAGAERMNALARHLAAATTDMAASMASQRASDASESRLCAPH